MIIGSKSDPRKSAKDRNPELGHCCLAGNEESVVMAAKCSYVLAQGSIPVVKTLIGGELGCYIYEGDTGS